MLYDASCIQFLPDASSERYEKSHATKSYCLNRPWKCLSFLSSSSISNLQRIVHLNAFFWVLDWLNAWYNWEWVHGRGIGEEDEVTILKMLGMRLRLTMKSYTVLFVARATCIFYQRKKNEKNTKYYYMQTLFVISQNTLTAALFLEPWLQLMYWIGKAGSQHPRKL